MRGYCPSCGDFIEGLSDIPPGITQQEIALLEMDKRIKLLEKQVKILMNMANKT